MISTEAGCSAAFAGNVDENPLQNLQCGYVLQQSLPSVRRIRARMRLPFQLDLLSTELLGDARSRALQSLPHYDRGKDDPLLNHETSKRIIRALHGYNFESSGNFRTFQGMPAPSLRCSEPFKGPIDLGRKAGGCKENGGQFACAWPKQAVFGRTLRSGEGV
jgi:hypothetical protein